MAEVRYEFLSDSHNCETCGTSYAEGYRIYVDGTLVKELLPVAHCFGGDNYYDDDLIAAILEHFGHTLDRKHC